MLPINARQKSEVRSQPTPNPDRGGEVGDLSNSPKIFGLKRRGFIPITKSNAILQLYFNSQIVTKIKSLFLTIISWLV
ncbi:MAG: hypothetical protein SWX82_20060 [Cyanobacteriota bacterium]|nr:hypothetical protein [Cyanobacteriota bacterium]